MDTRYLAIFAVAFVAFTFAMSALFSVDVPDARQLAPVFPVIVLVVLLRRAGK